MQNRRNGAISRLNPFSTSINIQQRDGTMQQLLNYGGEFVYKLLGAEAILMHAID